MEALRHEVIERLLFSKYLLHEAEARLLPDCSDFEFASGLLQLHDACDAAVGALADHLHVPLSPEMTLLKIIDSIQKISNSNSILLYKTQIRNLNDIRNKLKHAGSFPDRSRSQHYILCVTDFIVQISREYLGLDFQSMCLSALIQNPELRGHVDDAIKSLDLGDYKNALVNIGYADQRMFFTPLVRVIMMRNSNNTTISDVQVTPYDRQLGLELLECGINIQKYRSYRNLLPNVIIKPDCELQHHWDREYGHEANWTGRNARMCLDFCIDCALKVQNRRNSIFGAISYYDAFTDKLIALEDNVEIIATSELAELFTYRILARGEVLEVKVVDEDDESLCIELPSKPEETLTLSVQKNKVEIQQVRKL